MSYGSNSLGTAPLGSTSQTKVTFSTTEITAFYTVGIGELQTGLLKNQRFSASYAVEQSELQTGLLQNQAFSYTANLETQQISGSTTLATSPIPASETLLDSRLSGQTLISSDIVLSSYDLSGSKITIVLGNEPVSASYTVQDSKFNNFGTQPVAAETVLQNSNLQDLNLDNKPVSASYTANQIGTDVQGAENRVTVLIEGERIDTYTNIEVNRRLNEVSTFSFDAFIGEPNDRALINEGNIVKIIEGYDTLLFKGKLTEVEYKSNFRAKCEGDGMVTKLLNRKTDRDTYSNTAGDQIVKSEVSNTVINYGTIETAPNVSVRFDHDNLARAVAGVANATGYDWYIGQQASDDWDTDYLNFVDDAGRDTSQATLAIGEDASLVERNKDEGFVANDITLLGRGDGINQLEANVFAAATAFTDTTQVIDEGETGSFTVDDATQLGSTGDDLIVRVGIETMDVTISDSTTLSINSRAVNDYAGNETPQIKHYDNIRVWRLENKTQGIGRFTPETRDTAEDGSSIESKGVKEQRDTDKTIVDLSTLEKTADLELKNRFEDVFRVQTRLSDPSQAKDFQLGDTVRVQDLTAMDVDDDFEIVGMDHMRSSAEEGTVLHLANRPRRLTERLSEIESDRDTLNAHMQGATNFNGESFEDNCDNTHPLANKVLVPSDVVKVNKFEVSFTRESFRGYVQNQNHSHDVDVTHPSHSHTIDNIPDHDHDVSINIPDHTHDIENLLEEDGTAIRFSSDGQTSVETSLDSLTSANIEISGSPDEIETGGIVTGSAGSDHTHDWPADTSAGLGTIEIDLSQSDLNHSHTYPSDSFVDTAIPCDILTTNNGNPPATTEAGGSTQVTETSNTQNTPDTTETTQAALGTTSTETSTDSGAPSYGIFEPSSEPDIDVDLIVDGNTVTTFNNVSVGDEINPVSVIDQLSEPIAGQYHEVKLVPVDTGGGNNGRSRLSADISQKVFIESTL